MRGGDGHREIETNCNRKLTPVFLKDDLSQGYSLPARQPRWKEVPSKSKNMRIKAMGPQLQTLVPMPKADTSTGVASRRVPMPQLRAGGWQDALRPQLRAGVWKDVLRPQLRVGMWGDAL